MLLQTDSAKSTRATYDTAWTKYHKYTTLNGYQALPITYNALANWIAEEVQFNKVQTIKQYISALRSKHIDKGLPVTVFSNPGITRMLAGAQRIYGAPSKRERLEITKDILLKMLATIDSSTFNGLNIYASFCVAFSGFFRPGELTWDKWDPNTHL